MSANPYMSTDHAVERLAREWHEHKELIIAYDFDNTVFDYHRDGEDYVSWTQVLHDAKEEGAYLIVFTAADESRYPHIREFLEENDIPYDSINEPKPGLNFTGRKLYYNILLDDRAGLGQAVDILQRTIIGRIGGIYPR